MNMMKYCPECYKELPPDSPSCPFCGYKTDNDEDHDPGPPKILKTPKTDSYIPPEQTLLSMLLLVIFFWGINIALTVLPIFLNAGTTQNLLIACISSQVLTRAMIGLWAYEEQSLKKDQTLSKKLGSFLLSFIPLGDMISFQGAAKTMVRKERLTNLSIASIAAAIIMSIMLYATADGISELTADPDSVAVLRKNKPDSSQSGNSEGITSTSSTPQSARTYPSDCRDPSSVKASEEGKIIEVCGKVTNFGDIDCKSCPLGFYSFITLNRTFQIISYDWRFSFAWLGDCMRVSDEVEILGDDPVFQFGKGEGYAGTECITDSRGELVCDGGIYFQDYFYCE